jgi:hypothetical protein
MLNQTGIVSPQSRDRGPRFNRREQPNALIEPFPLPSQFRSDGGQFGPFPDLRPRNHLVWSQSELKGIGGEPLETSDLVQRGIRAEQLDENAIERYCCWLRHRKHVRAEDVCSLVRLLDLLREHRITPRCTTCNGCVRSNV